MQFNFWKKSQLSHKNNSDDNKQKIINELLRQSRLSFNLAFSVTAASALTTILGVGLLYLGKLPEASLTSGGGALATISSINFAKEAKKELCEIIEDLEE